MNIDQLRREYKYASLTKTGVDHNPIQQFASWLNEALEAKVAEPTAMSLATIGKAGFPESRIVLLKFFDDNGFVFFTNYNSSKGSAIALNPSVGLHFFWPELERQVRISGYAAKTSTEVSDKYFQTRPLKSQIAAIVSNQSQEIENRSRLENDFKTTEETYLNSKLMRPEHWGGYSVKPEIVEFWQGRENRLHDRILYQKHGNEWVIKRLAP